MSEELKKDQTDTKFKKTLKTLFSYLLADKKTLFLGLLFSALNSLFYIVGSFLIGSIVTWYIQPIIEGKQLIFNTKGFWVTLSLLVTSFLLYGTCRYIENYLYVKVSFGAGERLRREIVLKLHKMPMNFYDRNKTGDLISTLIVDVNNVANSLFQVLTQIPGNIFSICVSIIILSLISGSLTLIIVPVSLLMFGLVFLLIKKSQPQFIKVQDSFGKLNAFVEEMVANTKVTNSFDQQEAIFESLKKITKEIRNTAYLGDVVAKSFDTLYGVISNTIILMISGIAALFYFNDVQAYGLASLGFQNANGTPSAGLIITYVSIAWNLMSPFQNILNSTFNLQIGIASSGRLFKLIHIQAPSKEHETIKPKEIQGLIEFKDVYFKYVPNSRKYQLQNASFVAKPGEVVAIVGPTGAGKTTIISLISKYYDYASGNITIDGNELRNIDTKTLRDNMTIVLQDSFLFNLTILDNLKLAKPNASMDEIIEAAKMTKAHHFIKSLPNGYNTMIENNGANISQGQKQLLSLTRAILSNRSILILDEATSNIDSATEQIVQKSMLHLMENKTSFVIAHRLSTIKNANKIIVIDNGFIIEQGNHKELLEKQGFYYDLYTSQFNNQAK
ncbi:ATP-binding cassette domain-containing protein [Mycoplasma sp. NEAQ87857]|nr:ATP-binding cassette domain-containing protein [Mycoplasma sp. NEAQ87857]